MISNSVGNPTELLLVDVAEAKGELVGFLRSALKVKVSPRSDLQNCGSHIS